jgi:hypothetical protein
MQAGKGGIPYIATHDGRTLRYPDPNIKVRAGARSGPGRARQERYPLGRPLGRRAARLLGSRGLGLGSALRCSEAPFS